MQQTGTYFKMPHLSFEVAVGRNETEKALVTAFVLASAEKRFIRAKSLKLRDQLLFSDRSHKSVDVSLFCVCNCTCKSTEEAKCTTKGTKHETSFCDSFPIFPSIVI